MHDFVAFDRSNNCFKTGFALILTFEVEPKLVKFSVILFVTIVAVDVTDIFSKLQPPRFRGKFSRVNRDDKLMGYIHMRMPCMPVVRSRIVETVQHMFDQKHLCGL